MNACSHEPDLDRVTWNGENASAPCKHGCGWEGFADVFWSWINTRDPGEAEETSP